jgi:hypothetical protein
VTVFGPIGAPEFIKQLSEFVHKVAAFKARDERRFQREVDVLRDVAGGGSGLDRVELAGITRTRLPSRLSSGRLSACTGDRSGPYNPLFYNYFCRGAPRENDLTWSFFSYNLLKPAPLTGRSTCKL